MGSEHILPQAALYVRVSTQEQATEGYSIQAQLERLRAYCTARGWQAVSYTHLNFIKIPYQEWWRDRPNETRQPASMQGAKSGGNSVRSTNRKMRHDGALSAGEGFFDVRNPPIFAVILS